MTGPTRLAQVLPPSPAIEAVHVVVPVRDEELLLPSCLDAVQIAADRLHQAHPTVRADVTVALDACTDGSADVVARRPDVRRIALTAGAVGAARAAGIEYAVRHGSTRRPGHTVWVATTDADSRVPPTWLTEQMAWAATGRHLVVGAVQPEPADLDPVLLASWWARHELPDGHEHVHGANLGFTMAAYRLAGGFPAVTVHEDVALVARIREMGIPSIATGRPRVVTSGRLRGRAQGGFADYLARLGAEPHGQDERDLDVAL